MNFPLALKVGIDRTNVSTLQTEGMVIVSCCCQSCYRHSCSISSISAHLVVTVHKLPVRVVLAGKGFPPYRYSTVSVERSESSRKHSNHMMKGYRFRGMTLPNLFKSVYVKEIFSYTY